MSAPTTKVEFGASSAFSANRAALEIQTLSPGNFSPSALTRRKIRLKTPPRRRDDLRVSVVRRIERTGENRAAFIRGRVVGSDGGRKRGFKRIVDDERRAPGDQRAVESTVGPAERAKFRGRSVAAPVEKIGALRIEERP